ncbi:MRS2-like protein [Saccharomyces kudriavzevii IFO 1802]|uniref:MRS2-like protein n=1 Tax=Saccharomyces kudriavzevii (strain ATCC MYA-4449 / AS 2.2408 / CBS 8840 / NBRC 1802 / NCYC 2889) TaxID=226230 RepID=J8TGY8_SACK1|nr:MRS2-like protein [Saccharomyces kudriavzevii IFO 1802]
MNRRLLVRSICGFQRLSRITLRRQNFPLLRHYSDTSTTAKTNGTILRKQLLSLKPISPSDSLFISCTVFNSKGNIIARYEKFRKWAFLTEHSLFARDLRKIVRSSINIIPAHDVQAELYSYQLTTYQGSHRTRQSLRFRHH